jgi:hypothetical protein
VHAGQDASHAGDVVVPALALALGSGQLLIAGARGAAAIGTPA